jgi:xylan 1,4-beta-xylosidase
MKLYITLFFLTFFCANIFAQNEPIILEAELGILGSDFSKVTENQIIYVKPLSDYASTSSPGNGTKIITFSVRFADIGTYDLYARVYIGANTYSDDSCYFGRDFGEKSPTTNSDWSIVNGIVEAGQSQTSETVTGTGNAGAQKWKWINISKFTAGITYKVSSINSVYTFQYGAREDGLFIDKLAFGKSSLFYTVGNLDNVEAGSEFDPNDKTVHYPDSAYSTVSTYVNPVLSGDFPDLTLLKDGTDFYACGSSFQYTPYGTILHSTDLVHWEEISRVIKPDWSGLINDAPAQGIWQGAITKFHDSYWFYFSNNAGGGQYFSKADSPYGPWSTPIKVVFPSETGSLGYDNSVFVDDDGTPYMLIKNGKYNNKIQKIGTDGHLTGSVIDLSWLNIDSKYSWAEGPVMCKRNGWYYYFIAGNIGGGQWVIRSQELTADPTKWEELGSFFAPITDGDVAFRGPNHISQPFQIADGTWWTLSHSYENISGNSWEGKGRQGLLHQVLWDVNGKPTGTAPTTKPMIKPALPKSYIAWKLPRSDYFSNEKLNLCWHFLNKAMTEKYSLTNKKGWLRLSPSAGKAHLLQKDAGHHYTLVTRVDVDANVNGQEAGIYLTNGNESVTIELASGYDNGKKILFRFNNNLFFANNSVGNIVWLKLVRNEHNLTGYYSADSKTWTKLGTIDSVDLDKSQPNYNWWVGNSNGLFASGVQADFDLYLYKDGFSEQLAAGYTNAFGIETLDNSVGKIVSNDSEQGGWLMLGGIDMGYDKRVPVKIEITASSISGSGMLEVWINDIQANGIKIASIPIASTGSLNTWNAFTASLSNITGQHDVYLKFIGAKNAIYIHTIRFIVDPEFTMGTSTFNKQNQLNIYPNPFTESFNIECNEDNIEYKIYNLLGLKLEEGVLNLGVNRLGIKLLPGIFLLEMVSGKERNTIKIIKM